MKHLIKMIINKDLDINVSQKDVTGYSGLQKDRYCGTTGPKEGLSPIGRFGLKGQFVLSIVIFLQK